MPDPRSTYCDECWPFHNAEVQQLTSDLEVSRRHVRTLNKKHEVERDENNRLRAQLNRVRPKDAHMPYTEKEIPHD